MRSLTKNEIISILEDERESNIEELFRQAREERDKVFGKKIFIYGFVYFSTWCRNDCNFCYFRKSNPIDRYRKSPEEVVEIAKQLAESGVHLIDLTMGEDLKYHKEDFKTVLEITGKIKEETKLPVMISPGVINDSLIDEFAALGTEWYALYQETHNRELFKKLRLDQDYDERMHSKLYAGKKGMLVEEGLLAGVGETFEDIADSLLELGQIGASQIRVMSFVPQKGSPMENAKTPDRSLEMKIIALMRVMYPYALIPASLDVDGIKGLEARINAGANVVTSIIPPKSGLMGVAQNMMDVDEGGRTAKEVGNILNSMGLTVATAAEYMEYLKVLKKGFI
ncbi:MAG TPA: methylornithine synthase PylB [Anaerovoracaceae bacterium]|nr:methylornithine synthase PylB [Anaerovoracaceae bacterium]